MSQDELMAGELMADGRPEDEWEQRHEELRTRVARARSLLRGRTWLDRLIPVGAALLGTAFLIAAAVTIAVGPQAVAHRAGPFIGGVAALGALALIVRGVWQLEASDQQKEPQDVHRARLDRAQQALRLFEAERVEGAGLTRRLYRFDISELLGQYRAESERYRRRHNRLQALVIVGSLGTTATAALQDALPGDRWITVITSFAVGIAAGFMGYFKFRERSFYLSQTADAIEEQATAMALRIGDYQRMSEDDATTLLIERVEALRNEQRKRQQQLDQPPDGQGAHPANA